MDAFQPHERKSKKDTNWGPFWEYGGRDDHEYIYYIIIISIITPEYYDKAHSFCLTKTSGVTEILRGQIINNQKQTNREAYTLLPKASFRYQNPISVLHRIIGIEFLH